MKTAVADAFPASAALILPCWKRKELSNSLVINSATILNKEKFGFNKQNRTPDLTQTYRSEGHLKNIYVRSKNKAIITTLHRKYCLLSGD